MKQALEVLLAGGGALITEAHDDRCWASEEVCAESIEVLDGTCCDICGEPIEDAADLQEKGESE